MFVPSHLQIGILQLPEYVPHSPLGGAEAMADQVARGLSKTYRVCVFHGFDAKQQTQPRRHGETLLSVAAFPITDVTLHHGIVDVTLREEVFNRMAECRVMISFERIMPNCPTRIKYAVLGGICYAHCGDIIESGCWDRLIVPSTFLYDEVAARSGVAVNKVTVIPNGLDQKIFSAGPFSSSRPAESRLDALIPSRPDWGKGFRRALALARAGRSLGRTITLHCFEQESFLGPTTFYQDLRRQAHGVDLMLHPWVDRKKMPSIYRSADLTLCLGDLPEGFGMTVIESISCGTPVLATPVGFLRYILPPRHGVFHYEENRPLGDTVDALDELVSTGGEDCRRSGIPYIAAHYSEDTMIGAYQALIEEDVGEFSLA